MKHFRNDIKQYRHQCDDVLYPEQKTALYEHCRTDAGKVPISAVVAEFAQIMEGMRDAEKK